MRILKKNFHQIITKCLKENKYVTKKTILKLITGTIFFL